MKVYRVGIIGLGCIACELPDNHFHSYSICPQTEVYGICDNVEDKLISVYNRASMFTDTGKMGEGFFPTDLLWTDFLQMVKERELDIVSVCTPPDTHREIVCDIAPYVKAIYCEKPIALSLEDATDMIDTCYYYNTILQINHQRLFVNPVFRFSRGIINTGTHMFSLINHLFKDDIKVDIMEVDTDEPVFELDCTHNKEPMILDGVKHLIKCIENGEESISSGVKAKEALRLALEYEKY